MDFDVAADLARRLIAQHGLRDWQFKFDRARRRFGSCSHARKTITLSRPLTMLNGLDEVRDTILHEIAHALAPGGHHQAWRNKCMQIGARPDRCYSGATVNVPAIKRGRRYVARCACGITHSKVRRPVRKYICRHCRAALVWAMEIPGNAAIVPAPTQLR